MDIRKIRKIIDLMKEKEVGEIELCEGEESVRINQSSGKNAHYNQDAPQIISSSREHAPSPPPSPDKNENAICSPMVGTFYTSPHPDSEPFVKAGQHVKTGEVLCIVEAMKMFNQIEADRPGKITLCLVENGQPVEFGQPLFIIE